MLEVKVICGCGQKFKFDTEPLEGRMAAIVLCPRCNADDTELANRDIAAKLAAVGASVAAPAPPAVPAAAKVGPARVSPASTPGASKPVPVVPAGAKPVAPATPPPPPPPAKDGLKVGNPPPAPAPTPSGAPPTAPPIAKVDDSGKGKAKSASTKKPSLVLACVGAFVGALLGTAVWVAVIYFTGIRSGYVALLVGVTAGFGAKLLGRGTRVSFGVMAALFTLIGIVGGNVVALTARVGDILSGAVEGAYAQRMAYAKEVTAAKNDDELKKVVARELASDQSDPQKVSASDLAKFKAEEVPKLKDLESGKVTKEQFEAQLLAEVMTKIDYGELLARIFSVGAIISWIIALGAAFRIASK